MRTNIRAASVTLATAGLLFGGAIAAEGADPAQQGLSTDSPVTTAAVATPAVTGPVYVGGWSRFPSGTQFAGFSSGLTIDVSVQVRYKAGDSAVICVKGKTVAWFDSDAYSVRMMTTDGIIPLGCIF